MLKLDRNNYKALVLLGAALQETDQRSEAPNAFMKAIDVSSDQILAYQGLASYYEKYDADNDNLLPVYNRLLSLEKYVLFIICILQYSNHLIISQSIFLLCCEIKLSDYYFT